MNDGDAIRLRVDTGDGHLTREGVVHFTAGFGGDAILTYADGSEETIEGGTVRYGEVLNLREGSDR